MPRKCRQRYFCEVRQGYRKCGSNNGSMFSESTGNTVGGSELVSLRTFPFTNQFSKRRKRLQILTRYHSALDIYEWFLAITHAFLGSLFLCFGDKASLCCLSCPRTLHVEGRLPLNSQRFACFCLLSAMKKPCATTPGLTLACSIEMFLVHP